MFLGALFFFFDTNLCPTQRIILLECACFGNLLQDRCLVVVDSVKTALCQSYTLSNEVLLTIVSSCAGCGKSRLSPLVSRTNHTVRQGGVTLSKLEVVMG